MRHVMVRYKVKPDRVEDNRALVKAVYAALERERPDGIRYATFESKDGVFVHVAVITTPDGASPLPALDAFKQFTAEIKDRCSEPPATSELEPVGSYRFLVE